MVDKILSYIQNIDKLLKQISALDNSTIWVKNVQHKFGQDEFELTFSWINHGISNVETRLMALIFQLKKFPKPDLKDKIIKAIDELKYKFELFSEISDGRFRKYKLKDLGSEEKPIPYQMFTLYIVNKAFHCTTKTSNEKFEKFRELVEKIKTVIKSLEDCARLIPN